MSNPIQQYPVNNIVHNVDFFSLDIRGTSVSIEGVTAALESLSETLIDLEYHSSFAAALKFSVGPNAGLLKLRKLEIDLDQFFDEEVTEKNLNENLTRSRPYQP